MSAYEYGSYTPSNNDAMKKIAQNLRERLVKDEENVQNSKKNCSKARKVRDNAYAEYDALRTLYNNNIWAKLKATNAQKEFDWKLNLEISSAIHKARLEGKSDAEISDIIKGIYINHASETKKYQTDVSSATDVASASATNKDTAYSSYTGEIFNTLGTDAELGNYLSTWRDDVFSYAKFNRWG